MVELINEALQWLLLISLVRQQFYFKDWSDEMRAYIGQANRRISDEISEIPDRHAEIGGLYETVFDLRDRVSALHGEVFLLQGELATIKDTRG